MTSVARSRGLWAAWSPDDRLQRSLGLGCAHPAQSVEASEHTPITTQQKHHVHGASSIILGDVGQEEEGRWLSLFLAPEQLGSVRHGCLGSSLVPERLLWQ